ncbi:MAG: RdgB/HAM1 family non-canonical purine NTP pyrophosphatase [Clostridia bacterium]|nr:RdgB/HAM1 family non-canonical purine NTP pyrophosphatase [Clostridia bacterium]
MKFLIATHNPHKLEELARILLPLGIEAVTDRDLGITLTEAEETGETFAQNAFLKAELACRESGLPAVADDSGLCVDALGGAPGVYSARYAPEGQLCATLLRNMADVPAEKRGAHFVSSVCCVFPNGDTVTAEGRCDGVIAEACRGEGGFGYDPVFEVEGDRTFAELSPAEKDAVSHRGRALGQFSEHLQAYLNKEKHSC